MGLYDVIKEYFMHKSLDGVMDEIEKQAGDSGKSNLFNSSEKVK